MRAFQIVPNYRVHLVEGGHALEKVGVHAIDVNRENYQQVRKQLEPILVDLGLKPLWTMGGSGSWNPEHPYHTDQTVKNISSDIDVMVDTDDLLKAFPPDDPAPPKRAPKTPKAVDPAKELTAKLGNSRLKLEQHLSSMGFPTTRSGVSVHVGIPVAEGEYVQVDIMAVEQAEHAIGGHEHDYSTDKGMSGGVLHGSMWADLTRMSVNPRTGKTRVIDKKGQENSALQLSPYKGLVDRETGDLIASWKDKDKIAKIIIGPTATKDDMASYTRLYKALQQYPEKLDSIRKYFPTQQ